MGIISRTETTITCNSCGKKEVVYDAHTILDMTQLFPEWFFLGWRKFCECPICSAKRFSKQERKQ